MKKANFKSKILRLFFYVSIISLIIPALIPQNSFAGTPTLGTITPSSGSSAADAAVTFTTTYNDAGGWAHIQYVYLLINTQVSGGYCFYGYYNQNTNKFYLRNDANSAWSGGYLPGSSYVIENSYAKLNCASCTVSGSGNTLTVTWSVTFKSSFTGAKNCYLYMMDDANASVSWTKKGTWLIDTPDTVGPTGTITINNNASYAKTTAVTLNLSAIDSGSGMGAGAKMLFSNDNTTWTSPEAYSTTKAWILPSVDGTKKVYAKFTDVTGNTSTAYSDTIILDTTAPTAVMVTDDGSSTAINTQLHATWTQSTDATSGISKYEYAIGTSSGGTNIVSWTSTGTTREVTRTGLSLTAGVRYYISIRVLDKAGNYSSVSSSDGILITNPPKITDVTFISANNFHQGWPVTIQAVASDADGHTIQYQYSIDGTIIQSWTTSSSITWNPATSDIGLKTVKVEVKTATETGNYKEKQVYIFRSPITPGV